MTQLLPDDLAAVPIAKITRAMKQLTVSITKSTMAAAVIVAHVYHLERWKEGKHESFAAWCEACGMTKQYGYDLVANADRSTIVDKNSHARELKGLTDETATAVVASAAGRGPVTAKSLREERERIESASVDDVRQARDKVLGRAREVNRGATDEQVERRAPKLIRKLADLLRQHSGCPEEHFDWLDRMKDYWQGQAELSRAA